MLKQPIQEVLNWNLQKADFDADGSLRDIYVLDTTIDDWKKVLALVFRGSFEAKLLRDEIAQAIPTDVESLFGTTGNRLRFSIHGVELACYFFTTEEIEFDFVPNSLTEESLLRLLEFMVAVGSATAREVIMTPENGQEVPIFRYDPAAQELKWVTPKPYRVRIS